MDRGVGRGIVPAKVDDTPGKCLDGAKKGVRRACMTNFFTPNCIFLIIEGQKSKVGSEKLLFGSRNKGKGVAVSPERYILEARRRRQFAAGGAKFTRTEEKLEAKAEQVRLSTQVVRGVGVQEDRLHSVQNKGKREGLVTLMRRVHTFRMSKETPQTEVNATRGV